MRVCYFIPMLDYATGWGRWTVDLLEEIPKHGVEPVLVVPPSQQEFHRELGLDKYETHLWGPEPYLWFQSLHKINFQGVRDIFTLQRNFSQLRNISLIHATDMYPWGYYGLQLKSTNGAPLVLTNHSKLLFRPWWSPLDYLLCGRALKGCDRICSVSSWSSGMIQTSYPRIPASKLIFIHNGVNAAKMAAGAETVKALAIERAKGPVLLSVTRFIRTKCIETSVRAFAAVKREFPDAVFYIVGPHTVQSYVDEIRELIRELKVQDIHLVGKTASFSELCQYYADADLLVHTSSSESFGLIFLEAGHFGLPVVATQVGGVQEVVDDGGNGILVGHGDHGAVAEAIMRILSDRSLAARLGDEGKNKAAFLTTGKVAEEYAELYRHLIRENRAR